MTAPASSTCRAGRARTCATPWPPRARLRAAGPGGPPTTADRSSTASPRRSSRGARTSARRPARSARRSTSSSTTPGWTDKLQPVLGGINPVAAPFLSFSQPEPTGVVGLVAPDEPELLGLVAELAPVLAAGNTLVAVLSEKGPLPGLDLGEVLGIADVPAGVVNLLSGRRAELAQALAGHHALNAIVDASADASLGRRDRQARRRVGDPSAPRRPHRLLRRGHRRSAEPPRGRDRAEDGLAPGRRLAPIVAGESRRPISRLDDSRACRAPADCGRCPRSSSAGTSSTPLMP